MDIPKLSRTERLILELLSGEEMFGLQLVEQSKGALKRGTVYVTLGRMQDKGYVESWTEKQPAGAIGLPRRLYRPTAYGLRVLAAWEAAARALTRSTQIAARLMMPGRTLHRLAARSAARKRSSASSSLRLRISEGYAGAERASSRVRALLTGYVAILKVMAVCAASMPSTQ